MEHTGFQTGTISVRCVGWTGLSAPLVKVFVDDQQVGVLRYKYAHEFTVPAGRHRVAVKRDFWRSLPLDLTVAAGALSELECSFQIWGSLMRLQMLKLPFFLAFILVLQRSY